MAQEFGAGAVVADPPLRMGYEEWVAWDAGREVRSEWVEGEVVISVPATLLHGLIVGFVLRLLADYVEFHGLGVVVAESVPMRVGRAGRVPDVIFVGSGKRDRLDNTRLLGGADLAVEVVSDDSLERDTVTKPAEYAAAGVPEL